MQIYIKLISVLKVIKSKEKCIRILIFRRKFNLVKFLDERSFTKNKKCVK